MDDFLQQTRASIEILFEHHFGEQPTSTQVLHSAGSNRIYLRLTRSNGKSVVGAFGSNAKENDAFIYLSQLFQTKSLPVPQIYAISDDHLCYLQSDLGDLSLHEVLASWKKTGYSLRVDTAGTPNVAANQQDINQQSLLNPPKNVEDFSKNVGDFSKNVVENPAILGDYIEVLRTLRNECHDKQPLLETIPQMALEGYQLLRNTIRLIANVQIKGGESLDTNHLLSPQTFDKRAIMFDLNYFKYCFLKPAGLPFDETALEDDFDAFASRLLQCDHAGSTFLYRDFQARNVMVYKGQPWLIDFQSGRKGPLHYDIASFLWQASAQYPDALRATLIEEYLDELSTLIAIDRDQFKEELLLFVLFRMLQVLGAYGLRGLYERKPYFLQSIPLALRQIEQLIDKGVTKHYPTLKSILSQLSQNTNIQLDKAYHAK